MASIYQPKGRNILRMEMRKNGKKLPVKNIPLTPELQKDYQWLRNLVREMERAAKSGSKLSDKSLEAVRKLRRTNPQLIQEMSDEGWFIAVTDYTIEEAFKEFIKQKERDGNASRTIKNWKNTAQRIFLYLNPTTPCSQITLKLVKDVFRSLRNHENRWGERFSPITLQKDSKNLRQLFRDLLENKDITENPIDKYRFKIEKWERPKPVPPVSDDVFRKVLRETFIPEELQQKTLLAYYRIMSARQNDPRFYPEEGHVGDHWEDVDLKKKMVNRWNVKHKAKQGYQPVPLGMWKLLMTWREAVIANEGQAVGPIFPWLNESTPSAQYDWFKRRVERVVPGCWEGFLKALRASRSREVRRMDNGRFLESQIVGHSEEVADKHYDAVEESDFEQIWNDPRWIDLEGEAA